MTDDEDRQEEIQDHVDAIRVDTAGPLLVGADVLGTYKPPTALLYGRGRDHESAQVAVNLLRKRFDRMAVRESAFAFDSTDGSVWGFVVESPGRPMDEAKIDQLRKEVGDAHSIGEKPE